MSDLPILGPGAEAGTVPTSAPGQSVRRLRLDDPALLPGRPSKRLPTAWPPSCCGRSHFIGGGWR